MNNLKYFIKLFIFWLFYFFINRLFFIANYFDEFSQVNTSELFQIFPKSIGLDLSFTAYLLAVITLVLFFNTHIVSTRFNSFISKIPANHSNGYIFCNFTNN